MKRLRRWILCLLAGLMLVTALPVLVLRWVPPPTSAVMVQRTIAESREQEYSWVPMERISPHAGLAVVAAEDQKFPFHWGFDLEAILDAIEHNERGGSIRGASTLTQQVARNLFLWQGRSYLRKGLEAWLATWIEILWPKGRILEVYLNIAEMGKSTFGVEAASRRYFGRSARELSPNQAALLAAVLPNPTRYRADRPSRYVQDRVDWILGQMSKLGGTAYLQGIWHTGPNPR